MANKRIKDITDTATAAASDDYLVIDGATNGTRKILSSNVGGGAMYDYTVNSGSTFTFSADTSLGRLFYCNASSVTAADLLNTKAYVVNGNYRYPIYLNYSYIPGSTYVTMWFRNIYSGSISGVWHVIAPFEITSDSASM